jgi:hypothetical protein
MTRLSGIIFPQTFVFRRERIGQAMLQIARGQFGQRPAQGINNLLLFNLGFLWAIPT